MSIKKSKEIQTLHVEVIENRLIRLLNHFLFLSLFIIFKYISPETTQWLDSQRSMSKCQSEKRDLKETGRWSASRRLGQGQGTLVLTASVHVSVRLSLIKRAPENHRGSVHHGRVFVCGAGGRMRRRRAGRALGSGGTLLRRGQGGGEGLEAGGRLQRNILHGSHVLQVQLFCVGGFVLLAVKEAGLFEGRIQIVLDAADDLQEGRPHFGVVLPAHAHQLKPEKIQTCKKFYQDIKTCCFIF